MKPLVSAGLQLQAAQGEAAPALDGMRGDRFRSVNFDDEAAVSILVVAGRAHYLRGRGARLRVAPALGPALNRHHAAELDFVSGHRGGGNFRRCGCGGLLRDGNP